jgi:hypothetical protein
MNLIFKTVSRKAHLVSLFLFLFTGMAFAQKKTAFLQLFGSVQDGSKNLSGAQLQVYENGSVVQTISAKDNGSFLVVLDLGKEFTLVYSKPGYVSKSIEVKTTVPPDAADIGYVFKCNVDLPEDVMGLSKADPMSKPIAKIAYNTGYEDFDYDAIYTKRVREEQAQAVKDAAALKLEMDKARLDSLNKIWSDSIAKVKEEQAAQASVRAAQDKARQDSILRAQAQSAAFAAAEKARIDSTTRAEAERRRQAEIAQEQARQDSLKAAMAELKKKQEEDKLAAIAAAREKSRQDSIVKAEAAAARLAEAARQKEIADSVTNSKALADARRKAEADSISRVRAEETARQKAAADSIEKSLAMEKFRRDSAARADAESARQAEIARQKSVADSVAGAKALAAANEARQKFVADSTAKANAEAVRLAEAKARADEESRLKAIADARAKALQDSTALANAEAAKKKEAEEALVRAHQEEQARKKFVADSIARADADAKAAVIAAEKAKADAEQAAKDAEFRQVQDSLAAITKAQKDKAEAERQARIQEEIQAKKEALAKASQIDTSRGGTVKPTTAVPKIRESDYQEGITDETVKESNRSIIRTVVKKDGVTFNYQKITYNWGGIFYFKNEQSITANLFDQELSIARKNFAK